ncbi:unnamed protein product [Psylliodes chrysocephalus]|uniref:Uncharacterized protein n=1 Tax=Psylliodes chrysocephalus TaxID=3402493 RepID=A0A9P0GFX3_9CUCU|nr:unnamed protein product [Psylliodes chrysocephala]
MTKQERRHYHRLVFLYIFFCFPMYFLLFCLGMLMNWLYFTKSAVEEIHVTYPIVGQSYIIYHFGRIEKGVKRKEVIIDPKEYRAIFSEFAAVLDMESDFDVFDLKKQ